MTVARDPRANAPVQRTPLPITGELDASLATVERAIADLGETLAQRDIAAIETSSAALQGALRAAMSQFAQAARRGPLPAALRDRVAQANARVAAQREALCRATALVEQHLEILLPRPLAQASVYAASGNSQRGPGRMLAAS